MFLFVLFVLSPKFLTFFNYFKFCLNVHLRYVFQKENMPTVSMGEQCQPEAAVKMLVLISENPKERLHLREQRVT